MATTKTTASDLVLEPTKTQLAKMAKAVVAHDGRNWELGELLQRYVPRGVSKFTVRHDEATASSSDTGTEVTEHSVFLRIFNDSGQTIPVATMKRLRNTAATFPVGKRCETATWSAHRAGESLAWRDEQGHRANFLTWLGDEPRTVTDVEDHVRAMMSHLDGTVIPPKGDKSKGETPSGHDLQAVPTDPAGKVEAFTAFTVSYREDPEAFAEFLAVIGRNWEIIGETLGAVPTDAELIEA